MTRPAKRCGSTKPWDRVYIVPKRKLIHVGRKIFLFSGVPVAT
jgi:hypothetical protein